MAISKASNKKKMIKSTKKVNSLGTALPFKPLDVVKAALKYLNSRDSDIISRRHGLRTGEKETLEEIGRTYQLTRERIRQIEAAAINRLREVSELRESLETLGLHLQSVLNRHGRVMEHKHFMDEFFGQDKKPDPLDQHALTFLAKHLLNQFILPVTGNDKNREGWKHIDAPWDLFEQTILTVKQILKAKTEPMSFDDLLVSLKATDWFKQNATALAEQHVLSYLRLSQELHRNAFSEWGMGYWNTIRPKRMSDKIYLILKKAGKPLHFQEITSQINAAGFSNKQAYKATVHNELILDERFVLVGRGLYALSEWGFKRGVVADVIADVMKANGGPITKEHLITEVLKQRLVKPATVNLALMNKKRFKKVAPKTYYLA